MSSALIAGVVIIAGFTALEEWLIRRRRERDIRRAESEYESQFDIAAARAQLDRYATLLRTVLPPSALLAPPVVAIDRTTLNATEQARAAVTFAAERFAVELPPFEVVYTPHITEGRLGEVCWDAPWDVEYAGERITVRPVADRPPNWRVRLREGLHLEPERLAVVAAHEVAHIVLLGRSIALPSTQANEQLTDAAAVLAGFGPLMQQTAFRVRHHPRRGRALEWSASTANYLHRGAIRYLMEQREVLRPSGVVDTSDISGSVT